MNQNILQPTVPVPLKNIRNSCYVNAILQTLFRCHKFNNSLQIHFRSTIQNSTNNTNQTSFCHIYRMMYRCFVTKNISLLNQLILQFRKMCKGLGEIEQQDTGEALSVILKQIHQELIPITPMFNFNIFHPHIHHSNNNQFDKYLKQQYDKLYQFDYSLVSKYFSLQTINIIECNICKQKTSKIEKNQQIILSIFDNYVPQINKNSGNNTINGNNTIHCNRNNTINGNNSVYGNNQNENTINTIDAALKHYFKPEYVPYCKKCTNCSNKDFGVTIHTFLLGPPIYLVIVLNRFYLDKKTLKCFKNHKYIDYDDTLCISPFLLKPSINIQYQLQSVINHQGEIDSGHYYCYQKYNNCWYKCNDEHIESTHNNLLTNNDKNDTYILVYEQNTT